MKTYAYIYKGAVWEIVEPKADSDGNEIPIETRFTEEYLAECVDITTITPAPEVGYSYNGTAFAAPAA